ncbi:MAG: anaerobic ribonucleoside-triphosphate reductase [Candidatus Omnitrophota bacterium]
MSEEKTKCRVEVFSRVTGFFQPVQLWNKGKTAEFEDRGKFTLPEQKEPDHDGAR